MLRRLAQPTETNIERLHQGVDGQICSHARSTLVAQWILPEYSQREKYPNPSLTLLDLALPQMSGFEVLSWMQGEPPESMPSVVVLSYSRNEHDKWLARKFGASDYFIKSPNLDDTVTLIKNLLTLNWIPSPPGDGLPKQCWPSELTHQRKALNLRSRVSFEMFAAASNHQTPIIGVFCLCVEQSTARCDGGNTPRLTPSYPRAHFPVILSR